MQLPCRSCNAEIKAGDMNLERMVAKCARCNAVFGFADSVEGQAQPIPASKKNLRDVPMPKAITIEQDTIGLQITRRWWSPVYAFLVFFTFAWFGFLVLWYVMAFAADAPLLAKLFPMIHVAAGLGIGYMALCGLFNRTRIAVDGSLLTVRHGPMPWP